MDPTTRRTTVARPVTALATALLTATALVGTTPARAAVADAGEAARAAMTSPTITWHACEGVLAQPLPQYAGVQCGDLVVPLDYSDPTLGTMTLPISRKPAGNPARRIGSLFTNPGGPGDPATIAAPFFADMFGSTVTDRFDVVGLAPRGVEGDTQATCDTPTDTTPSTVTFPLTDAEVQQRLAWDRALATSCSRGPAILQHMSTADDARDMDLARRALGDERLTYFGVSYGSYLGETYAALFPTTVRAMVLDGVIDPVAWAKGHGSDALTQPTSERLWQGGASKYALQAAITACERAGTTACPEAGTIRDDWRLLTQTLWAHPVTLPDGSVLRYDRLHADVISALYGADQVGPLLTQVHRLADDVADPDSVPVGQVQPGAAVAAGTQAGVDALARLDALARTSRIVPSPLGLAAAPQSRVAFNAVVCSESPNPSTTSAFLTADDRARVETGGFGAVWLWQSSICTQWPFTAADAYHGGFSTPTSAPVLLLNNEQDPATPLLDAETYHRTLSTTRLVTVAGGFGHGVMDSSSCATAVRNSYLLTGTAPSDDVTCAPDKPLFPQP